MRPLDLLEQWLSTDDPAATITRVFKSKHVADLRWIVSCAIVGLIFLVLVALVASVENQLVNHWKEATESRSVWGWVRLLFAAAGQFLAFVLPVLAAFGGLVVWAYQAASKRLGVVDLFACEISTLCKISAVLDSIHHVIEQFEQGPVPIDRDAPERRAERPFLSEENYFPVFEGNSSDLQTLEAPVVIQITSFYTYMKALRDSLRVMANVRPEAADFTWGSAGALATGPWHEAARNVIYVWFLGFESARHSVKELVEFEPDEAERTIVILLGELEAYRFLREQFTDPRDVHTGRIQVRETEYRKTVPELFEIVRAGRREDNEKGDTHWLPAEILLPELRRRYEAAIQVRLPRPSRDVHRPAPLAPRESETPVLERAPAELH